MIAGIYTPGFCYRPSPVQQMTAAGTFLSDIQTIVEIYNTIRAVTQT
jgi:hypothetical protein